MKKLICEAMLFSGLLALSQTGYGQTVKWSPFAPAGSGCNQSNTSVVVFGDTISWVFEKLSVKLTGGFAPGSDNKFCAIRAGAEVAQGIYLAELTQSLSYGAVKNKGSSGSIATNSSFFGYNVSPINVSFPPNLVLDDEFAILTQKRTDDFKVIAPPNYWCNPNRNPKGLFTSRIAVNGLVNNPGATIALAANEFAVKFEATLIWYRC